MADPSVQEPLEDGVGQADDRPRQWRTWGGLLLLATVAVLLVWVFLESVAVVPNTVGMTRKRSVELIGNAGFQASVATVTAADRLAGRVVGQAPPSGWYFKPWPVHVSVGAAVSASGVGVLGSPGYAQTAGDFGLSANSGTATVQMPVDAEEVSPLYTPPTTAADRLMPDVLNRPESQALAAIRGAGLTSIEINRGGATTDVRNGHIYFQYPPPGADVSARPHAIVWVSTGPFNADGTYLGGGTYPRP